MTEYGMIYDSGSIKQQLAEANRDYRGRKTWENLYSSIDVAEQQQIGTLKQDYAKAVADAYSAAYQTNQAIASSNLGEGYKLAAMDETDLALEQAYDTYRQNYLQGKSEIENIAAESAANVDVALTEQAEYTKQFANAPYEYLQYVFNKYAEGDEADNIFLTDEMWKRYTYTDEESGEMLLKPWEDIAAYGAYDEYTDEFGNVQKEWTGLFDESGNLTIKGTDFYDQMINQLAYEGTGLSFGQWLSENNEELYNWSQSYNPYDYTEAGSNVGSFKTLVGMTSTDEQYSFIERFGGISRKELDTMYSKFTTKMSELNSKVNSSSGRDSKDILSEFKGLTNEIKTLTDDLGITESLESEMGITFDALAEGLADLAEGSLSNGDIWWQGILTTGSQIGVGAAIGAKAGPLGALAGAIIGTITGVISGIAGSESSKAQNRELAKAGRDAYNNLVTELVAYSHAQQRQKQSDFYRQNR